MLALAFVWSLLLSLFTNTKRKDFWMMLVHHVVTVMIMSISWICNFHRVMIVVHFINNFSEVPLEFGKSVKYVTGKSSLFMFKIFLISWFVPRLIIFPLYYLYVLTLAPSHPLIFLNHFLCAIMMVLNVIWSKLIFDASKKIFRVKTKIETKNPWSSSDESEN
jgi:sphingoid base N-palmitoyltransferase